MVNGERNGRERTEMRRFIAIILAVLIMTACVPAATQEQPAVTPETEPAQDQKEARFPSFSTENLSGDIVTEQVFAGKSVTMINIWGTYCGPCINEMPALQELNSQLPDSAQILGIIVDVSTDDKGNLQTARKIADGAGVTFDNVILNEELAWALSGVQFIPTTVFVDSDGRMVGEVIVGANTCAYINRLESLLDGWNYKG